MSDGLRVLLAGTSRGKDGAILSPVLQHFLSEGSGLVADPKFGFVGGAAALAVALDDVENLLKTLAQLRTSGQSLVETASGRFPNGRTRELIIGRFVHIFPLERHPLPQPPPPAHHF